MQPHHFIFNRAWYEELGGRQDLENYKEELSKFSASDKADLLAALSIFENRKFEAIRAGVSNRKVAKLLRFYKELDDQVERNIWDRQKLAANGNLGDLGFGAIPEDELVEDAGLELDICMN